MKTENKSTLPRYNISNGIIDVLLAERRIYNRKEFMEALEKKRSTLENVKRQSEGMEMQIQQAKEGMEQSVKDIANLQKYIKEDESVASEFLDKYKAQCEEAIIKVAEENAVFTHLAKFDKTWSKNDMTWKDWEWERAAMLEKVHTAPNLIKQYPDSMIKGIVWGAEYDPMQLQKESEE